VPSEAARRAGRSSSQCELGHPRCADSAVRGTPDMPLPELAARALLEAFELALEEPSGALLDLRKLRPSSP